MRIGNHSEAIVAHCVHRNSAPTLFPLNLLSAPSGGELTGLCAEGAGATASALGAETAHLILNCVV